MQEKRGQEIEQYIREFLDGDESAFSRLYQHTEKYIYACIAGYGLPEEAVFDVMQEVYLAAYEGMNSLRDIHAALGWMKKIAFHKSMDYFRREKKNLRLQEEEADRLDKGELSDKIELPEDVMEKKELRQLMQELLLQLSEEDRLFLKAYYFGECSIKDIAGWLEMSENTVKTKLARARKRLKEEVLKLEKEEGIRLHSVAAVPALLLLYDMQAEAAFVPKELSDMVVAGLQQSLPALAGLWHGTDGAGMSGSAEGGAGIGGETGSGAGIGGETGGGAGNSGETGESTGLAGKAAGFTGAAGRRLLVAAVLLLFAGAMVIPPILKDRGRGSGNKGQSGYKQDTATKTASKGAVSEGDIAKMASKGAVSEGDIAKTASGEAATREAVERGKDRKAIEDYYKKMYRKMKSSHKWPDGSDMNEIYDYGEPLYYIVEDFDGDGDPEFGVRVENAAYMAARTERIFKYNPDTKKCSKIAEMLPGATYYSDGKAYGAKAEAYRMGANILLFSREKGKYIDKGWVLLWEYSPYMKEYGGDKFPKKADKDGDKKLWRLEKTDGEVKYMDNAEFAQWKEELLPKEAQMNLKWIKFSKGWKY